MEWGVDGVGRRSNPMTTAVDDEPEEEKREEKVPTLLGDGRIRRRRPLIPQRRRP